MLTLRRTILLLVALLLLTQLSVAQRRLKPVTAPIPPPKKPEDTGQADIPLLRPKWTAEPWYETKNKEGQRWVQQALNKLREKKQPELTAFFPILAKRKDEKKDRDRLLVVFRSYSGIHAVDPETGAIWWQQPFSWSIQTILGREDGQFDAAFRKRQVIEDWLSFYIKDSQRPGIVFENSLIGTLSSDSHFVYAVEDLPVPPVPHKPGFLDILRGQWDVAWGPPVTSAIHQNRLIAFSLQSDGKLAWELNGPDEKGELEGCFFLGPPLPLGDKLYVLTEKKKELRLVCIDPEAKKAKGFYQPKLLWTLPLARTRWGMDEDPMRRLWAAPLACADGILVVPTNAGAVFGVNLLTRSISWVRPYTLKADRTREGLSGIIIEHDGRPIFIRPDGKPIVPIRGSRSWSASAPVVSDGRILLAAPDSEELVCLALMDGSVKWSIPLRKDDLYLACVFQGRVVVVGRQKTRGLSLATGKTLWEAETGEPTGQGVADSSRYFLPVVSATGRPGLCVLDVAKGSIIARVSMRGEKPIEPLGNLLFYRDRLISQTPTGLVAYPASEPSRRLLDK